MHFNIPIKDNGKPRKFCMLGCFVTPQIKPNADAKVIQTSTVAIVAREMMLPFPNHRRTFSLHYNMMENSQAGCK